MSSAQQTAETATFQSFANCFLREINPGISVIHREGSRSCECIEWTLASQRLVLRAEISSRSLCGPLHFGSLWTRPAADAQWRSIEPMSALPFLIQDASRLFEGSRHESARAYELGLMQRVLQSYQGTAENLAVARPLAADGFTFLDAERTIAYGHWLHPTPKSREGMSFWQQGSYAPEFGGDSRCAILLRRTISFGLTAQSAEVRRTSCARSPRMRRLLRARPSSRCIPCKQRH